MTVRDDEDRKAFEEIICKPNSIPVGRMRSNPGFYQNVDAFEHLETWQAALAYARQKHEAEMAALVKFVAKEETAREWDDGTAESTVAAFRAQQKKEPGDE